MAWLQHFISYHSIFRYAGIFQPVADIQEAQALVMRFHIKSEIIGSWLYCFTTPLIGFQLETIGFWFSFKHNAYVFSGSPKEEPAGEETLDEIRCCIGCQLLRG